ncbi:MAG: hypothetical protein HF973_15250 [Chloroflexi bacterium]|nr:hypothetical protein [Chloroflexota bacterium]
MADPDIIYAKVGNIQNCLHRIGQVTNLNPGALDEFDAQDIFVLNLQRAVQAAIDLAAHVVASEELGLPDSLRAILQNNLGDLEDFYRVILNYYNL